MEMTTMPTTEAKIARRPLNFARLDEVMADVDRLLEGHETVGKWSLGQVCHHLAETIRCSVEGFPTHMPWPIRRAIGPWIYRKIDRDGRMPAGIKAPAYLQPSPGLDARDGAESLREAIRLYQANGPIAEHPIFGPFTPSQWERIHCIHCAHHLSFARPPG
jgi:hypothetical protein